MLEWRGAVAQRGLIRSTEYFTPRVKDVSRAFVVIAGLVPAIHLARAWTTGTSPVVTVG